MTTTSAGRSLGNKVDTTTDAELMASLSRDGDGLAVLLKRYQRYVFRVALNVLRDAGEAEDVTQEVFLEVYCRSELYDPSRGSVRGWLLQYAYHRSLRRKYALRRRASYGSEPLDRVDKTTQDNPRGLTRQERRWVIRAALARLPERQRVALQLVCFEELDLRGVAERLRVSFGCARHYYYRGLARVSGWAAERTVPLARARS